MDKEEKEEVLKVLPVDGVTDNLYHFNFTGGVEVQWEESGMVGCEVCMVGREAGEAVSEGREEHLSQVCSRGEEIPYFLSETPAGHSIDGGRREVVEGDEVELRYF